VGPATAIRRENARKWARQARFRAYLALTASIKLAQFRATREANSQSSGFTEKLGGFLMNKNDLIGAVAESSGLTRTDATKAVEGVFEAISGALKGGDEVRLVGFGTFSVAKRKASTGRSTPRPPPAT
jgi:nucleoid DNA-binding protein